MADIAFEKDLSVAGCPRHYIMRSSWVIGEGHNFAKTMNGLSDSVADPDDMLDKITVVDDQLGRLTFMRDMAEAVFHVLDTRAPYGIYNCTGSGAVKSWADIARAVFEAANGNGEKVVPVSTADYYANAAGPITPRSTCPSLRLPAFTCPIGRRSWGSTCLCFNIQFYFQNEPMVHEGLADGRALHALYCMAHCAVKQISVIKLDGIEC